MLYDRPYFSIFALPLKWRPRQLPRPSYGTAKQQSKSLFSHHKTVRFNRKNLIIDILHFSNVLNNNVDNNSSNVSDKPDSSVNFRRPFQTLPTTSSACSVEMPFQQQHNQTNFVSYKYMLYYNFNFPHTYMT